MSEDSPKQKRWIFAVVGGVIVVLVGCYFYYRGSGTAESAAADTSLMGQVGVYVPFLRPEITVKEDNSFLARVKRFFTNPFGVAVGAGALGVATYAATQSSRTSARDTPLSKLVDLIAENKGKSALGAAVVLGGAGYAGYQYCQKKKEKGEEQKGRSTPASLSDPDAASPPENARSQPALGKKTAEYVKQLGDLLAELEKSQTAMNKIPKNKRDKDWQVECDKYNKEADTESRKAKCTSTRGIKWRLLNAKRKREDPSKRPEHGYPPIKASREKWGLVTLANQLIKNMKDLTQKATSSKVASRTPPANRQPPKPKRKKKNGMGESDAVATKPQPDLDQATAACVTELKRLLGALKSSLGSMTKYKTELEKNKDRIFGPNLKSEYYPMHRPFKKYVEEANGGGGVNDQNVGILKRLQNALSQRENNPQKGGIKTNLLRNAKTLETNMHEWIEKAKGLLKKR